MRYAKACARCTSSTAGCRAPCCSRYSPRKASARRFVPTPVRTFSKTVGIIFWLERDRRCARASRGGLGTLPLARRSRRAAWNEIVGEQCEQPLRLQLHRDRCRRVRQHQQEAEDRLPDAATLRIEDAGARDEDSADEDPAHEYQSEARPDDAI